MASDSTSTTLGATASASSAWSNVLTRLAARSKSAPAPGAAHASQPSSPSQAWTSPNSLRPSDSQSAAQETRQPSQKLLHRVSLCVVGNELERGGVDLTHRA